MGLTRIRAEQISDIDYKQAVRVVQTSNITLAGGAPNSVDGVNLGSNDRVLVTGQNTGSQNGLYRVQTLGTGSNGTWVRTTDGNTDGEIEAGMLVMVTEGETYRDTLWKLITNNPIVIGTTALTFELNTDFGFGNIYANGTGVTATVQSDVLTLTAGTNMTIIGNAATKTITFSSTGGSSSDFTNVNSNIIPSANLTYSLGNATNQWANIYVGGNTIFLGNLQLKDDGGNTLGVYAADGTTPAAIDATAGLAQYVTQAAQGNITSVGTLTSLSVTGNTTSGNLISSAVGFSAANANANISTVSTIVGWSYESSFSTAAQDTEPRGVFFKSDGTRMYVVGQAGDDIVQYDLGTPWSVSTATYSNAYVVSAQSTTPYDVSFKDDGTAMYVLDGGNDTIFQYTLSSAWDVGTASYASISFSVTAEEATPAGMWFKPDGTKLYVIGSSGDDVNEYNLGTAWNIGTASFLRVSSALSAYESSPEGLSFSADGAKMWIIGPAYNRITQFSLSTPWDVSTLSFSNYLPIAGSGPYFVLGASGLYVNEAAGVAYVSDYQNDRIFQYSTDTPTGQLLGPQWTSEFDLNVGNNLSVNQHIWVGGTGRIVGGLTSATSMATPNFATTTATGTTSLITGTTSGIINFGTGLTSGTLNIGGTAQTGAITIGQSTGNHTTNISAGITATGATKTLNIGTAGGNGSTTTINIGSSTNGAISVTNIQGGNLGTAANSTANIATMSTGVSNGSYIRYYAWRESASASDWTTAATRIQQRIDVTDQGYIQFNGVGLNYGIELGTGPITSSEKFIRCYQNGNVALYYDNTVKFATATDGVTLTGNMNNGQANGVGNIGSSTTYFNTVFAKATSAQYADLAEIYISDADYPPGTVVAFGGAQEITQSLRYAQTSVAGVVSTNPAYIMNAGADGLPVALQGRVPCRVVGTVRKGDLVAASDTAGVATRLDPQDWAPGAVIGKALGDHDSDIEGVIEVVVGRV